MISTLQFFVLAVCALVTLLRLPAALRGENRSLFGIFLLVTAGMLLSIQWSYALIDGALGSNNYANLVLRYVVYGTVLLAGYKIAKGFENANTLRLLIGPVGLTVLAVICLATAVPFLMADTAGTSVGLSALPDQSPHNRQLIALYTTAGRLYPAFVAACLLPATTNVFRSRLPGLVRGGAALLTVGSAAMILLAVSDLLPQPLAFIQYIISLTSVLGLVVGLALIWFGKVRARRTARTSPAVSRRRRAPGPEKMGAEEL